MGQDCSKKVDVAQSKARMCLPTGNNNEHLYRLARKETGLHFPEQHPTISNADQPKEKNPKTWSMR